MEKKKGSGDNWIIFSVVAVILPLTLAIFISFLINRSFPDISELLSDIVLVLFSISCNLISICYTVYKQKEDEYTKKFLFFPSILALTTLILYIASLTNPFNYKIVIIVLSIILISVCIFLGKKFGDKSDENENEIILSMHNNCSQIRKKLLSEECNNSLGSNEVYTYDLICNPKQFERVKYNIEEYLDRKNKEK